MNYFIFQINLKENFHNIILGFSCSILSSNYPECKAHYPLLQRSLFMCRYKRIRKQKYIFDCSIFFETRMVVHVYVHKSVCLCTIWCVSLCMRISAQIILMGTRLKSYRAYCYRRIFLYVLIIKFEEKTYMWVFVIPFSAHRP